MYPNQPNHPNASHTGGWQAPQPPISVAPASRDKKPLLTLVVASIAAVLALASLVVSLTNDGGDSPAGNAALPSQEQRDKTACQIAILSFATKNKGAEAWVAGQKAQDAAEVSNGLGTILAATNAVQQSIPLVSPELQSVFSDWVAAQKTYVVDDANGSAADAADAKLKSACGV